MDNANCDPTTVFYIDAVGFGGGNVDSIESLCVQANTAFGQCAIDACIVEGNFVARYFELLQLQADINPDYKHGNGKFVVNQECPTNPGSASERKCCGSYPNRYPYRTLNDQRKCCGSTTYSKITPQK